MKSITILFKWTALQILLSVTLLFQLLYNPWTLLCKTNHQEITKAINSTFTCAKHKQILEKLQEFTNNPHYDLINFKIVSLQYCPHFQRILKDLANFQPCVHIHDAEYEISNVNSEFKKLEVLKEIDVFKYDLKENIILDKLLSLITYTNLSIERTKVDFKNTLNSIQTAGYQNITLFELINVIQPKLINQLKWLIRKIKNLDDEKEIFKTKNGLNDVIDMGDMLAVLNSRNNSKHLIFFTETSGTGIIKPRFVCSLESAARVYTESDIYLLVAYIPSPGLLKIHNEALDRVLQNFHNVHVLNVNLTSLFLNSPIESLYFSGQLNSSSFLAAHTSDLLRILAVWTYGGSYFDMDVMTVKKLKDLTNFIIQESSQDVTNIANGAFAFEKNSSIGTYILKALKKKFNGGDWSGNGPGMFLEAMKNHTGVGRVQEMNETNLKEFVRLRYETLFPVEWFELWKYFYENNTNVIMDRIANVKGLWGLHVGNNIVKGNKIRLGSMQSYGLLAQKYCPRSYWACYYEF